MNVNLFMGGIARRKGSKTTLAWQSKEIRGNTSFVRIAITYIAQQPEGTIVPKSVKLIQSLLDRAPEDYAELCTECFQRSEISKAKTMREIENLSDYSIFLGAKLKRRANLKLIE